MLIRKEDFFYVSTGITGDTEMIPLEPQDAEEIRKFLERDDIEELMVNICEDDVEMLKVIERDFEEGGTAIDDLITKIIKSREKIMASLTETLVRTELESLYAKMCYDSLQKKLRPEEQQDFELERLFELEEQTTGPAE